MSMLRRSTVKMVSIIASVWLFYFLSSQFIMIGPIKVEVSVQENHETIKFTRGFRVFFPRNRMLCGLIEFLYIVAATTCTGIFFVYIGNAVRKRLDKMITNRKGVLEAVNKTSAFTLKSIVTSVVFSVACLIVALLIRNNFYLRSLARMEHEIIRFVLRRPEKVPSVYLFKVEPLLSFYYSISIIAYLLSLSHWLPLIFPILPNEYSKDGLIVNINMYREDLAQNDQETLDAKNAETAKEPLLDNPTSIANIKENELSIIMV